MCSMCQNVTLNVFNCVETLSQNFELGMLLIREESYKSDIPTNSYYPKDIFPTILKT